MNVVYGYAGASFSGRMPNADLADSIVETGTFKVLNMVKTIEVLFCKTVCNKISFANG